MCINCWNDTKDVRVWKFLRSIFLILEMRPATLLKKRLWYRCFPVNFVKFLKAIFNIKHLWRLLLKYEQIHKYLWICSHLERSLFFVQGRFIETSVFALNTFPLFSKTFVHSVEQTHEKR